MMILREIKDYNYGASSLDGFIRFYIKPELFDEPIIKEAMADIEHVYKIEGLAFYSSDYGVKSPESLSNGMKALLLFLCYGRGEFDKLVSNCCMGENCSKYLQQLSLKYDFEVSWDVFLGLDVNQPLLAKDYDTGTVFHDAASVMLFY